MILLFYFTLWAVAIFYISWLVHYGWKRITGTKNRERFYYQRSFRIIFLIMVFVVLVINLVIKIQSAKPG